MKKLAILTLAVVLTSIRLSATTLFDPNFSNQTGYTAVTSGGGTISYSGDTMTDGDVSNSVQAYASGSAVNPNANIIHSSFTFTPTFTANPNFTDENTTYSGNYEGINLFSIGAGGNNALLSATLYISTYNNDDQIGLNSGLQYHGGIQGGPGTTQYYAPGGINALSGQTLTINNTLTVNGSNYNPATGAGYMLTDHGVLTNSQGQVLYTFDYTKTSDTFANGGGVGSDYNPADADLTFAVGDVSNGAPPSFVSGTDTPNGNFLLSPASVTFSNVNVSVPEPSTYAMLLSGLALLIVGIRRRLNA